MSYEDDILEQNDRRVIMVSGTVVSPVVHDDYDSSHLVLVPHQYHLSTLEGLQ